jgi:O-antigen/teichoic acid export membrane protein
MTVLSSSAVSTTVAPVPRALDDRLNRNARSLIASSVLTSVFGFAFWILAARTMSTADVGTGSAVVAALVLLGNMSTLGLRNALPRFLPSARADTSRVIALSYLACAATALVVGVVFVLGAGRWADDLTSLRTSLLAQVLFVVAVAIWAVFVLQDSVLVGLRTAAWVPIENLAYALLKVGALLGLAFVGSWAIPITWIVPALALLVPLNVLIFRRLSPAHAALPVVADDVRADWRLVGRFAAGNHVADIVRFLGVEGVVLVVLAHLGPEASAPLFFAITIAASLQLVASNVMSAFVAEAVARPARVDELLHRSAVQISILVVPGALIAAVAAPLGLALFGKEFVESGTPVLRLLLIASIPGIALSVAVGLARYQRRVDHLMLLAFAASVPPVVGAMFFVPTFGIVAVGWATLVGHTLLAAVLMFTSLRPLLSSQRASAIDVVLNARLRIRQRRRTTAAATVFDELDATRGDAAPLWPRSVIATEADTVVARVDTEPARIVKVALSENASLGLAHHATAIEAMRAATDGTPSQLLVPELIEIGTCSAQTYVVESACVGSRADVADDDTMGAVADAFGALHRATARVRLPGDDLAYAIVTVPCRSLLADQRLSRYAATINALESSLTGALDRPELQVARTHGDCWLGNVMIDRSLQPPIVTGVVDWENSIECGLPEVDIAHLWLSEDPAGSAAGTLSSFRAGRFEDYVGACGRSPVNADLPASLVITLAWLAHIANGLERSSTFALGRLWISRNATPVLDLLDEVGPARVIH